MAHKRLPFSGITKDLDQTKEKKRERNKRLFLSLVMFLRLKGGQMVFRDFLKSEFCEENLDFWLTCQDFQSFDNREELTQRATRIYEEFIRADAPKQVNLDFKTRELISESLQHPSPSCFVVAQRRIYGLMENGSFPRFIQSEQYKGLCHASSSGLGKHRKPFQMKCTGDSVRHDSKPIILS
uniref:RGS domain-containing protein n=1 Tax=Mola mola TaxID=94237 RepID=A0A3Q3XA56_MOLML